MMTYFIVLAAAAQAYLLGSVDTGILVSKYLYHDDVRNHGSGAAGMTNMLRTFGKKAAALTAAGDVLKGVAAVCIGRWLFGFLPADAAVSPYLGVYLTAILAVVGHTKPIYFGFKGGKGVLTTLGMMLILDWRVALICLGFFIVVVLISRMVSLGSVVAAALLPVFTYIFRAFVEKQSGSTVIFCTAMAVLIAAILIIKHIPNIKRICAGTESKFSFGSKNKEPKA